MSIAIIKLENELDSLRERLRNTSNRQIGYSIEDEIKDIEDSVKSLKSNFGLIVNNIPDNELVNIESINQSSMEDGLQMISQVYFRKGANWVKKELMKDV